ncbi:MAG: glycosyl hydrolase [Blastochloris sp.]|nr:glycosyl hydrolase [Blastochloris sp.]
MIDTLQTWALAEYANAHTHVERLHKRIGSAFVHATVGGRYMPHDADEWTSGFWPGMLLLTYRHTGDLQLLRAAASAEAELERAITDDRLYRLHHDVGFQFSPTAVSRYKLTGDPVARRRGFLAANLLMGRFNPAGGFIEAWNTEDRRGMVIIDSMMNLPLLFWAAEEFHQPRFRNAALAHAHTTLRSHVRANGETHHVIRFDQTTGAPLEALGGQGYAPDSCWSRGQGWALYGFTLAYRYTRHPDFLLTARRVADNFLAALPPEGVPPWDFRAPYATTAPRDSSAGAIAASGLLELAALLPGGEGRPYAVVAAELLHALFERCGTASAGDDNSLLCHATGHYPSGRNIDVGLIYGDYFYLEALGKLVGQTATCW